MALEQRSMELAEIGPAPPFQKSNPSVQYPPCPTLIGEHALLLSKTTEGSAMVTNFRFCVCERRSFINVPLMMIGDLEVNDTYRWLKVCCKDAATYSCTFATMEDCHACVSLLRQRTGLPRDMKDLFAFRFYAMATYKGSFDGGLTAAEVEQIALCKPVSETFAYTFGKEVARQGFDTSVRRIWRMSHANEEFEFCQTYPQYHIMPTTIDDAELRRSLDFRAMKRFPSVVWRDKKLGVVLIRSSQPMSSFLGLSYFSNHADVSLLEKIVEACHKEREAIAEEQQRQSSRALLDSHAQGMPTAGAPARENEDGAQGSLVPPDQTPASGHGASQGTHQPSDLGKLAIVDCRSVATVWGNSLKGGGTEDEVVYKCSIIHLDLANIHSVRDSFIKLRTLCHSYVEGSYFKSLSGCMWLTYISALLRGANIVVDLMQVQRRPVLVHCSDGWDRTSQICSLSELMMDKYYRTFEGFQVLVEREWLHFGHKFAERGGHDLHCSDTNQISPVFLQFLDCVYQLTLQYPAEFQFNEAYLVKLLKHSQACLFGTFLHNSERERKGSERTASLWSLLQPGNTQFVNLLYKPTLETLTAKYAEHDVTLWKNVYMAGLSPWRHGSHADFHMDSSLLGSSGDEAGGIARSKSMDDLSKAYGDTGRRNSDPMVTQNQESAASASPGAPSSGNIHDTSSSSAEILHYPEDLTPPKNEGKESKASESDASGSPISGGKEESACDPKSEGSPVREDGHVSPQVPPSEENATEDSQDQGADASAAAVEVSNAQTVPATLDEADKDLSPDSCLKAQNLMPSSSSVFSGVDDVEDSSLSAGEHTVCCNSASNDNDSSNSSSLARLPIATTTTVLAGTITNVTDSIESCPSTTNQALSESSSSSSSPSLVAASAPSVARGGKLLSDASRLPLEACLHKDNESLISPVCKDTISSSLPVSPVVFPSSSFSNASPSEQDCRSPTSLLSERLAVAVETSPHPLTDRTNYFPSLTTSDKITQHSRRESEDINDLTTKLKTGAVLEASRKSNGISAAGLYTNGVAFSPSKSAYQNGTSIPVSPTSKHVHHMHHQLNGSVEEVGPQALSESTDTLVDQPLGVEINADAKRNSGSSTKRGASNSGASRALCSVSPSSSHSSPCLLTASPQRRDGGSVRSQESPDSPQYIQQSRRARAASGASRDLSVSPCNSCKGAWADAGRLRNPSGGGEMLSRRWIGATVATSTSDISDSCVGKVNKNTVALMERGATLRQHVDVDSLTLFCDERQDLLAEVVAEKDRKILELESRLCQARDIIRANRERQQQQCTSSSAHLNGHSGLLDELSITEAEGGELSSLGTLSNAASDASWEAIEDSEEKIVLWVPDSSVTHCAGCDGQFWMAKRKHHCRNCGKVFCWECSNFLAPVPHQHLNKPQRVCSRCHSSLLQLSPGASSDGRIPTLVADG